MNGDCISRQAAIDATWFEPSYTDPLNVLTEVRDRLKALPSAQPEQIARDIATIIENEKDMRVILQNTERTETHSCDYQRTETHDLVSRGAAIEALRRAEALTRAFGYHNVIDTIRELPSVQPERKRGKWIKLYTGNYKCSECGDWWGNDDNNMIENFHYCPNCGADMRG